MGVIIFDLDGTLIDSAPDICAAGNIVLRDQGVAEMDLPEARSFIGSGAPILIERMIAARGLDPALKDTMLAQLLDLYEDAVHLTTLYPGVTDCLDALADAGHILGICTNKPEAPTKSVLRHFDMQDRFGAVFGGDTLPVRKPDPAPLLACHRALGGGPALYVGDSEVDAATAQAAALPFALFTRGYRKTPVDELPHTYVFDHFDALPDIAARCFA
ncbi:phosphoglycolate phosphatase [Oceaniglobus ichthyenteri]|uniref:phosphoglycolate phosphatase n=1 Tax=Oceaniglobus ichthyenteri TaxID=2136177 RepID=UPI001F0C03CA|nr:phosphoglycolate phosphatase [Oceaniglobus ichthyenteri]